MSSQRRHLIFRPSAWGFLASINSRARKKRSDSFIKLWMPWLSVLPRTLSLGFELSCPSVLTKQVFLSQMLQETMHASGWIVCIAPDRHLRGDTARLHSASGSLCRISFFCQVDVFQGRLHFRVFDKMQSLYAYKFMDVQLDCIQCVDSFTFATVQLSITSTLCWRGHTALSYLWAS